MSEGDKLKGREVLIVRTHVESRGGIVRVVRLEPSKLGTRLLTSTSTSINGDSLEPPRVAWLTRKLKEAA
jgi:hypothetical protein